MPPTYRIESIKNSRGGEGSPLREFFKEALQLRPEFRRKLQQRSDKALAIGFVRFCHKLVDHEGKLLVHGAFYEHFASSITYPCLGDMKNAADVRDRAVAGPACTGANLRDKWNANVKLLRKPRLGNAEMTDEEQYAIIDGIYNITSYDDRISRE